MKSFVWCTDIHLDFVEDRVNVFAAQIAQQRPSGVFLTGDISLAPDVARHLRSVYDVVKRPIYYVCGNHDFYMGSIQDVRRQLSDLMREVPDIKYLTRSGHIDLTSKSAIVGHDGWYDAYHGDPLRSPYVMTDWFKISEYINVNGVRMTGAYGPQVNASVVVSLSRKFAAEASDHVYATASAAARTKELVVVLTHVPPFPEVHLHDGKGASAMSMPWYTSKMMGDALLRVASENRDTRFEVFCGHTHSQCDAQIADNLFCHVGGASYGSPGTSGVVSVP